MPEKKPHFIPRNGGRKPMEVTDADRNTVRNMAACGFRRDQIARCVGGYGVNEKTLLKYFKQDLETAALMANATVGSKIFECAKKGEPWAACFWMKARAGWRETQAHEISGPAGAPMEVNVSASELLARRIAGIAARIGKGGGTKEPE